MELHYTNTTMTKIKKTDHIKCWWGCRATELLYIDLGTVKWYCYLTQVWLLTSKSQ